MYYTNSFCRHFCHYRQRIAIVALNVIIDINVIVAIIANGPTNSDKRLRT